MEAKNRAQGALELNAIGSTDLASFASGQPKNGLPPKDADLRACIIAHCQWFATFDREAAKAAYLRYRALLPWLGL